LIFFLQRIFSAECKSICSHLFLFSSRTAEFTHSPLTWSKKPGPFHSSLSCFKANCLPLLTQNCTERLMSVSVKAGFLSWCLMAVLLCSWLFICLWCLQLLAAVT